ncbi:MAG: sigma-54 dependent transcriptional regulator [Campylobacterota bacterium]|nr:sigma-54 dependent transcriptional regulator [Campylobacterota bacterium]
MKIAIVEDDINMRKSLEIAMSDYEEFEVLSFKNARDALKKLDDSFELIISDINMPGMDGIEFVKTLDGRFEIILITGNATLQRAIESIQLGVKDFLLKPFEIETLVTAIKRSDKAQRTVKTVKKSTSTKKKNGFLANSEALDKLLHVTDKAAKTDASIMLLGESGVGKEVFARYIHDNSPRAKKPFIAINMAAIPDNLIESELFGFEKGAFTDAIEAKVGQFETAQGGTVFLDEIGEMPFGVQAKLLRALQEREIRRLGSQKPIKIDVRIISATNADLHDKIKESEFREDLYYRLNTIPLHIPALRERQEEILPIAMATLEQNCEQYGFETKTFSQEAQNALLAYKWPGNIRELISVVERATILSDGHIINPDTLFLESRGLKQKRSIANMEAELIEEILLTCKQDLKESSEMLGMSQSLLEKKIKLYNLEGEV